METNTRKSICDKLFEIYKTEDLKWTNQWYTSVSLALFKQQCGYIPESSYDINAQEMLGDYYLWALQWCSTNDIPGDVINIE